MNIEWKELLLHVTVKVRNSYGWKSTRRKTAMYGVTIQELVNKMKLKNATPELDAEKIVLTHPDVNRPALQLAGFFDHFDNERV